MVMNELIFADYSSIDRKLVSAWQEQKRKEIIDWTVFVKTQDDGIISCLRLNGRKTKVIFKSEAHKTWFLLKWSS
jgi:hypothetical protein